MRILSCVSVALALSVAGLLVGQSITGDLVVNVTDPSGSAVSGAKLSLIQVETNVRLDAQTDALGNYLFSQLKPGRFALEVSGPGFQKTNLTDIVITLGQRARVDVKLTVGTLTETVNVSAAAETLLNAESASVGQVITSAPIVELPLNGSILFNWPRFRRAQPRSASALRPPLPGQDGPTRRFRLPADARRTTASW
jgi:hypothetical protein